MGLFELSSWGEGGIKRKSEKKKSKKRRKNFQASPNKEKVNKPGEENISKSKKKKFDPTIKNISTGNEKITESPKKKKNKQRKKQLQQINLTTNNSPTINGKKKKQRKILSSKISRETLLPIIKKKSTFVTVKGPVLDKLENVNNKAEKLSVKKRKFKKNRRQNFETEKLEKNELTTSSASKGKKRRKFSPKKETMNFNSPKKMVLEKKKNMVDEKKLMENKGKNTNKRNRLEIEGEKEQVITSKKRRKSNKNSGEKNQLSKKIDVNTLKGMLKDKEEEKKKPNWENSSSTLRERMIAQLRSSRFRFINETLYNNASFESKKYFKDDPEAFDAYHKGFQQQVDNWPLNPVDIIIESIKKVPKDFIVADFGCGEAKIAESISQKVHSFDFVAMNDKVTVCDMAHTPLLKNGVNIVVFCLSLMGTNLNDYLLEANRVLKKGGIMKIAEVESRFENIEDFIKLVTNYGFVNTWSDLSNDLFYFLDFKKEKDIEKGKSKLPAIELKPCLYKRR